MATERDLFPASTPHEDDGAAHSQWSAMRVIETGGNSGQPASPNSTKVAWTLRARNSGRFLYTYAFAINPQAISRVENPRAQGFATKGGIIVNDFGSGLTQITLHQLVAVGHIVPTNRGLVEVETLREDVLRFLKQIYLPATAPGGADKYRVFFHDNHFESGRADEVYFPAQSLTLQRSVDLHNVWVLDLMMTGLTFDTAGEIAVDDSPSTPPVNTRRYVVRAGDTLNKIVGRLAGARASQKRRNTVLATILKLNPFVRHRRVLHRGSPNFVGTTTITVMPMRIAPGEVLTLPA